MSVPGTAGKVLFVDLSTRQLWIETPADEVYLAYLGGYGLGAYYLYKLQEPGADPLGPDNLLGFFPGLLTGTGGITANRYTVVARSPKTGTWGDANAGGHFGPAVKRAGFDGVVVRGTSPEPVYLLLHNGRAEIRSADAWWGWDTHTVDEAVTALYGKEAKAVCVGPAGERQSLLACIINDRGRAAGRSGLGAVMGSKRLKAVVAFGNRPVTMADADGMKTLAARYRELLREHPGFRNYRTYGTAGSTAAGCARGDTPLGNWAATPADFPTARKISDDAVAAIQKKKYACWRCPIGCGGLTEVAEGPFASRGHKPEYETLASFGALCLNDDLGSVNLCNNLCNRAGLDTIGTGCTIAFAIECFERGILTRGDTGGLELRWGNAASIVELTRQIAEGRGLGPLLADGARAAAERIGRGSEEYAIHIQGEEVPMHDPRLNPALATSYKMDATPARHTQMGAWAVEDGFAPPGLVTETIQRYRYEGKGKIHARVSNHFHAAASAGTCMMAWWLLPPELLCESLFWATGRAFSLEDVDRIGARIAALRTAFNLREGLRNVDFKIPDRVLGRPPLADGPTAGVTIDLDTQVRDYLEAMNWDPETGIPTRETLAALGLDFVAADLHPQSVPTPPLYRKPSPDLFLGDTPGEMM